GASLDVRAGEVLALVGPNGAGKSTLLGVITGDVEEASGSVTINDHPSYAWNTRELAMRRAVLLQQVDVSFAF
ncbi:ATP-binding cassette domain-containing protein, partial [Brevibacterium paucivorans]